MHEGEFAKSGNGCLNFKSFTKEEPCYLYLTSGTNEITVVEQLPVDMNGAVAIIPRMERKPDSKRK